MQGKGQLLKTMKEYLKNKTHTHTHRLRLHAVFKHVLLRGVDVVFFFTFSRAPCFSLTRYTACTDTRSVFANSDGQPVPGADTRPPGCKSPSPHSFHLFVVYLYIYLEAFSPHKCMYME